MVAVMDNGFCMFQYIIGQGGSAGVKDMMFASYTHMLSLFMKKRT